jgi:hypothetical protein
MKISFLVHLPWALSASSYTWSLGASLWTDPPTARQSSDWVSHLKSDFFWKENFSKRTIFTVFPYNYLVLLLVKRFSACWATFFCTFQPRHTYLTDIKSLFPKIYWQICLCTTFLFHPQWTARVKSLILLRQRFRVRLLERHCALARGKCFRVCCWCRFGEGEAWHRPRWENRSIIQIWIGRYVVVVFSSVLENS